MASDVDDEAAADAAEERAAPKPTRSSRFGRRLFGGLVGIGVVATLTGGAIREALRTAPGISALGLGGGFRIYTVTTIPTMARDDWKLTVGGDLVDPATFSYEDLRALGVRTFTSDFHCVTGWSVPDCRWSGVPLTTVLDTVGAPPDAGYVNCFSFDGAYVESLDMDQARLAENMVAFELDGEPISKEQGFPARLIVPEMYGYKGTKWLSRIEVSSEKRVGYWVARGYDDDGWIGRSNGYTS